MKSQHIYIYIYIYINITYRLELSEDIGFKLALKVVIVCYASQMDRQCVSITLCAYGSKFSDTILCRELLRSNAT